MAASCSTPVFSSRGDGTAVLRTKVCLSGVFSLSSQDTYGKNLAKDWHFVCRLKVSQ